MDKEFIESFTKIVKDIENLELTGLIVYGEGRHFSSGADTDELIQLSHGDSGNFFKINIDNFLWLENRPYPTIAAVSGCALGFGMELALACNYRISTKNAIFSLPESGFGLMPGCGGTIRLPELIGKANAVRYILDGSMISSEEALRIGLIDMVVKKNLLLETARDLVVKNN